MKGMYTSKHALGPPYALIGFEFWKIQSSHDAESAANSPPIYTRLLVSYSVIKRAGLLDI